MILLVSSLIVLLVGPAVYRLFRGHVRTLSILDGFIFVAITGIVILDILPHTLETGGWLIVPFFLAGLFGPTLLERFFRQSAKQTHLAALALALAGITFHAVVDGTALSYGLSSVSQGGGGLLPLAVVLHRFPVGLTIWWLLRPSFGIRAPAAVIGLVSLATVAGFSLGPILTGGFSGQGIAWFQVFVAGSLLHVVFHQPHLGQGHCDCPKAALSENKFEGVGALLGFILLALLVAGEFGAHGDGLVSTALGTLFTLVYESAPALLLAYVASGLLNAFLPKSSVAWLSRGNSLSSSIRGMALGLPFPVCSCGVVPLYRTLIGKGVPAAAAMAFLISTPELGLDAILLSVPLLGTQMTLIRVFAACLVALLIGLILGRLLQNQPSPVPTANPDTCADQSPEKLGGRFLAGIRVGLGEVVDHTAPWIMLGLCVAALIDPVLQGSWLSRIPDSVEVLLFALLGVPTYVCASGATPLVAVLLYNGVSPGAALAFLLTGPATNLTTFGILGQLHGKRIALAFSLSIIGLSLSLGYLANWMFPIIAVPEIKQIGPEDLSAFRLVCLIALCALFLSSIVRRGARRFVGELLFQDERAIDLRPVYHLRRLSG